MEHTDINTLQLRQLLDNFSKELEMSFLERRSKSQTHKQSPLEELTDAVKELTEREKQLQAAVGIARMLLDNNDILSHRVEHAIEKKLHKKQVISGLKAELEAFKDTIHALEDKNDTLSRELVNAEDQLLQLANHNKQLQQLRELKISNHEANQEEIEATIREYKQEVALAQKARLDADHSNKLLHQALQTAEATAEAQREQMARQEKENHKLSSRLAEATLCATEVQEQLSAKTNEALTLQTSLQQARTKIKELEEELYLLENSPVKFNSQTATKSPAPKLNLLNELASLDDSDSFKPAKRLQTVGTIGVPSKVRAPASDPCAEFFSLATQAIKMNSPYMDAICTIPTQALYKKAVSLQVPFNKWYTWIEDELTSAYLQILYQKDLTRNRAFGNKVK